MRKTYHRVGFSEAQKAELWERLAPKIAVFMAAENFWSASSVTSGKKCRSAGIGFPLATLAQFPGTAFEYYFELVDKACLELTTSLRGFMGMLCLTHRRDGSDLPPEPPPNLKATFSNGFLAGAPRLLLTVAPGQLHR